MNPSPVLRALYSIEAPKARVEITPEAGDLYGTQPLTMSSPDGAEIRYESAQGTDAEGTPNNPPREPIQGDVSDGTGSPIYDTSAASPTTITLNQGTVETPEIYTYWIRAFKDGLNPGDIIKLTFRVYPQKAGTLEPNLDAGNYRGNQTLELTLTPADPAAAIFYTVTQTADGTEPAEPADPIATNPAEGIAGSTEYDSAAGIPLNAPAPQAGDLPNIFIVKARAFAAGKVPGDILRLRYEIRAPKVDPVVIEDEPGDTFGRTLLKLSSATPDAEIRYTLTNDGTEPAEPVQGPEAAGGSPIYDPAAPPSIKPDALNQLKTFRIKARAFKTGFLSSDVSPVKSFALKVTVKQIYAGGLLTTGSNAPSTLFLLLEDGSLWGVGDNRYGQLGNGTPTSSSSPTVTTFTRVMEGAGKPLTNAKEVTGSWNFTAVLKNDGTVYTFGNNGYGQLGQGDTTSRSYAAKVNGQSGIVSIAAGTDHLILVNQSGGAFAAGRGNSGQLATARSAFPSHSPIFGRMVERIGTSNITAANIAKASAGYNHSLLLTKNGQVRAAGKNSAGQLGITTTANENILKPVRAAGGLDNLSDVADIGGFGRTSMFVLKTGELLGTGMNESEQLGLPQSLANTVSRPARLGRYSGSSLQTPITNAASLSRGSQIYNFTFYIDTNERVHGAGRILYGQFPTVALNLNQFTQVPGIQNVRSVIAADSAYMVFLLADGSLRVTNADASPLKDYAEGSGNPRNVNPLK